MTMKAVYSITLFLMIGVLVGGRFVEVVFYEWDFYANHWELIPAVWLGGMATHGLLLGAVLGTLAFCWKHGKNFIRVADELVIPAAWVMGIGRIGNFIDGQIAGGVTDVFWAVKFPDLDGFRHPVVLYDGIKNLLLIPVLLWIRSRRPPSGVVFASFVFGYAFFRLGVDVFREYRVTQLGLGTGQWINLTMSLIGLALLIYFFARRRHAVRDQTPPVRTRDSEHNAPPTWWQRIAFAALLLLCLTIPSDWTQDIPERYGDRHPGMEHSMLYPPIKR